MSRIYASQDNLSVSDFRVGIFEEFGRTPMVLMRILLTIFPDPRLLSISHEYAHDEC